MPASAPGVFIDHLNHLANRVQTIGYHLGGTPLRSGHKLAVNHQEAAVLTLKEALNYHLVRVGLGKLNRLLIAGYRPVLPLVLRFPATTIVVALLVTASAGIAFGETNGAVIEHVMARADNALYAAKRAGRNRVESGTLRLAS